MSYNLQRLFIFPRGTLLSFCCLLYLLASHSTPNAIMGGPINQTSWLERPQLDREEAEEPLIFVLTSDSAIAGTPTIISREGLPGGEPGNYTKTRLIAAGVDLYTAVVARLRPEDVTPAGTAKE
uniref:Uncharacterized protein n=1 Tax=Fagus sylvatica TaxID=28930 RepID=A0A2N9GHC5_FAGSY